MNEKSLAEGQEIRKVTYWGSNTNERFAQFLDWENNQIYKRLDDGRWVPQSTWKNGKDEILIFEVFDKKGKLLFTVRGDTLDPEWEPFDEMVIRQANEFAQEKGLLSQEAWENYLKREKRKAGYIRPMSCWLYGEVQENSACVVRRFRYFEIHMEIRKTHCQHLVCGKTWVRYDIYNTDFHCYEGLCGYRW